MAILCNSGALPATVLLLLWYSNKLDSITIRPSDCQRKKTLAIILCQSLLTHHSQRDNGGSPNGLVTFENVRPQRPVGPAGVFFCSRISVPIASHAVLAIDLNRKRRRETRPVLLLGFLD